MRISTRREDPGFSPIAAKAKIFFNGKLQSADLTKRTPITADEKLGYFLYSMPHPTKIHTQMERSETGLVKIVLPREEEEAEEGMHGLRSTLKRRRR